ncbi:sensor histidine kinase [Lentibacillus sediminis]|uniref:sensor histidine kinase n=1 Tax=Lentibacillus sediminis TaxID=1940529 RepID=UPI000C1B8662|nr:HAMP domain-containing sensor histidine kinase [Lentibacillus sediminis]
MKLQHQLNIAFTTLLIVILGVASFVIYSMILDLLIEDERRQLEQSGEILVNVMTDRYGSLNIQQFNEVLQQQDLQLFLYDRNADAVLFSTMPSEAAEGIFSANDFADNEEALWEYNGHNFVTSRILFYPEALGLELILLTPMSDISAVQQNFIFLIAVVFLIGAGVAVLLSYFMTDKLVTPLTQLKRQLKKIEKRQFSDMERIRATGEIKEVEQSVYEMAQELKRYMDSQQGFFQNASHELKTPLMTIQGYAEGIRDGIFDEKDTEKGLEVMVAEVNRLKKIINEMILLAKLDSEPGVYEPEQLEVSALIDQVMERALPFVMESEMTLDRNVQDELLVKADPEKLLRALLNLVFNGLRHAHSKVHVRAFRENRGTVITVEDDGEGVAEELIPTIFHRFVKGESGETGLGLAIARAIVEQSGGKISVGASELGGAKFVIVFPGG